MAKQQAKIKNWRLIVLDYEPVLIGEIFDHPKQDTFKKDTQVTTRLLNINFEKGTAETKNTIYKLVGG